MGGFSPLYLEGWNVGVISPALDAWHRRLVGEAAQRCLAALRVYEDMPCYCYLGRPPNIREPCTKGHCSNINDMPQTVLDMVLAYSNNRAEIEDIENLANARLCYNGPNWIKQVMCLATMPPRGLLVKHSMFKELDEDIAEFLDSYI